MPYVEYRGSKIYNETHCLRCGAGQEYNACGYCFVGCAKCWESWEQHREVLKESLKNDRIMFFERCERHEDAWKTYWVINRSTRWTAVLWPHHKETEESCDHCGRQAQAQLSVKKREYCISLILVQIVATNGRDRHSAFHWRNSGTLM